LYDVRVKLLGQQMRSPHVAATTWSPQTLPAHKLFHEFGMLFTAVRVVW
jgi:hypothetical protein